MSSLSYRRGDELPVWQETVTLNGVAPDFTSGWTFGVTLSKTGEDDVVKTTGILGASGGVVQVQWALDELDIASGTWRGVLVGTRDSDGRAWSARRRLFIR